MTFFVLINCLLFLIIIVIVPQILLLLLDMGLALLNLCFISLAVPLTTLLTILLVMLDQLLHNLVVFNAWCLLAHLSQHASVPERLLGQLLLPL